MVEEADARPTPRAPGAVPVTGSPPTTSSARAASSGDESFGWAGRVMVFLRFATQIVAVNVLVLLGTLAGGVLLGLLPALGSGGSLLARLAAGDPSDRLTLAYATRFQEGDAAFGLRRDRVDVDLLIRERTDAGHGYLLKRTSSGLLNSRLRGNDRFLGEHNSR